MALKRKSRGGLQKGKSVLAAAGGMFKGKGKGAAAGPRKTRTRGMYMRKGRLFLGFGQKEIKNAMRRVYGGRRKK